MKVRLSYLFENENSNYHKNLVTFSINEYNCCALTMRTLTNHFWVIFIRIFLWRQMPISIRNYYCWSSRNLHSSKLQFQNKAVWQCKSFNCDTRVTENREQKEGEETQNLQKILRHSMSFRSSNRRRQGRRALILLNRSFSTYMGTYPSLK